MTIRTLLNRTAAATAFAAALTLAGACAHHNTTTATDYGHATGTPAVAGAPERTTPTPIAGPAKIDQSGNVYTSSAAPATGNSATLGTNTNVNVIPDKSGETAVSYSEQPAPPAPPAPVITPAPMESSAPPLPPVEHPRLKKE